jgi:hypothetical protein
MSRMLDALRTLEARRPGGAAPIPAITPASSWHPSLSLETEPTHETEPADLVGDEPRGTNSIVAVPRIVDSSTTYSTEAASQPLTVWPPSVACCLPTTLDVSDHYLELAARISEQVASTYCNVLLFVSPDRAWENCFSLTFMSQAFVLQSPGEVLLVDGDFRGRRLSKSIGLAGPGLGEVMLGAAHWPEVIHPTNASGIDFVGCGDRQLPTLERTEFGWNALRPQYRAVLIGVALTGQPETDWLAARCDGVYLVISRPNTKRQAASAAVSSLRDGGANVLGCIVLDN